MDRLADALQIGGIVAARIPARAGARVGNAVRDALVVRLAGGVRVFAWKVQRFAAQADGHRLGIAAEEFAVDGVEILLHIGLVGMVVALHVVEQDGLDAKSGRPLDNVVDVGRPRRRDVELLDHDVDGVIARVDGRQQFAVVVVVDAAAGVDADIVVERRAVEMPLGEEWRALQVHQVLQVDGRLEGILLRRRDGDGVRLHS